MHHFSTYYHGMKRSHDQDSTSCRSDWPCYEFLCLPGAAQLAIEELLPDQIWQPNDLEYHHPKYSGLKSRSTELGLRLEPNHALYECVHKNSDTQRSTTAGSPDFVHRPLNLILWELICKQDDHPWLHSVEQWSLFDFEFVDWLERIKEFWQVQVIR